MGLSVRARRRRNKPGRRLVHLAAAAAGVFALSACEAGERPNAKVILAEAPAPKLSDYGFFLDAAAREPAAGVVAYDLVNPLFSDHAGKHRYVFVPEGERAVYSENDVFDFPVGSVLIKTFAFAPDMRQPARNERYIETRLLIRKKDGWVAYPYIWNADETEAVYEPVGGRRMIETVAPDGEALAINYAIPNRNQCKTCHAKGDALTPIGPKARSLNHAGPAGANQIADWIDRGILAIEAPAGVATSKPAAPFAFDVSEPLDARARAWLDINCAHCHNAEGSASNSGLYLDWTETDPTGWGVRKRPTAAGRGSGDNLFVIEPGAPSESILIHRLESTEPGVLMPELGRTVVDRKGLDLVRQWIAAMPPAGAGGSAP